MGGQVTPSKCQMQRSVVIIVSALRAVMVLAWNILEEPRSGCGSVDGRGRGRGRWWWWVIERQFQERRTGLANGGNDE